MTDGSRELTKQPKLKASCPMCDGKDLFNMPDNVRPPSDIVAPLFACTKCRRVFEVAMVSCTQNGGPVNVFSFKYVGDMEKFDPELHK